MTKLVKQTHNKLSLSIPVQYLKVVGPARAKVFAQLGVATVGDLLEYFPRDWVFVPDAIKINQIQADHDVTIIGLLESTDYQSYRRLPVFEAVVADDTGACRIV